MFNFETVPQFSQLTQWMMPNGKVYDIYPMGSSGFNFTECVDGMDELSINLFEKRPESLIYGDKSLMSFHSDMDEYEAYLFGTGIARYANNNWNETNNINFNPDSCVEIMNKCVEWLRSTDFYKAPSSTRYHDCVEGGLCRHTLNVVGNIKDLMKIDKWKDIVDPASAILVALVHDWCKINLYESYMRNVKNEDTGVWEKKLSYRTKGDPMMNLGHGVSSMYLAQVFFKLSVEEALAIRWHMGEYNVADNEMNDLHRANEKYPLVQLLQFADRLSIVQY